MKKLVVLVMSFTITLIFSNSFVFAQTGTSSKVGKKAANKYLKNRRKTPKTAKSIARAPQATARPRYMALHFGTFIDDEVYKWGTGNDKNVGNLTVGVSYRMGEWINSMDLLFRGDIITYKLKEKTPVKLSVMPMVVFPDANSQFPLYFGAGVGLGIFFKQVQDESSLSFDYQVVAGGRFFDVFDSIGLMFETGLKNHFHLLSDGQYNGVFVSLGSVFAF